MNTKRIRKLSVVLVFSMLVTFLFSVNVFAADKYVTKTMTLGKTVAVTSQSYASGSYTYTMYKFTVPSGKYVSLSCTPVANRYAYAYIFTKANAGSSYKVASLYGDEKKAWTQKVALEPGTYYVSFDSVVKANLTLLTSPNKANYCRSKAIALESGKLTTVVQTLETDYNRWYKISLTKAKTLKITSNHSANFYVCNKKGARVNLGSYNSSTKSVSTTNKLSKGTYYICVRANNYSYDNSAYSLKGEYLTFKWS